jgi:hypothetical protein
MIPIRELSTVPEGPPLLAAGKHPAFPKPTRWGDDDPAQDAFYWCGVDSGE